MEEEQKKKYEQLEKGLASMNIASIEERVHGLFRSSKECQKEMIDILFYLRISSRWKENKRYAKESFWTYILNEFNMREGTYRENERAFYKFPDESIKYGVGLIARVMRVCDPVRIKTVLNEVNKADQTKEIRHDQIDRIIEKYKNPRREVQEHKDWKAMYDRETAAHEKTKAALKAAIERNKDLEEQIEKLKKTASLIPAMRKVWKEHGIAAT